MANMQTYRAAVVDPVELATSDDALGFTRMGSKTRGRYRYKAALHRGLHRSLKRLAHSMAGAGEVAVVRRGQ